MSMRIPGLKALWDRTLGNPQVCIAVLDGPVDLSHPSFTGACLSQIELVVPTATNRGSALAHGTHVASTIFGQHSGTIKGISPDCKGISIPIFKDGANGVVAPCSQLDLARAINQAVLSGAHVINISGGEISPSATAHPFLTESIKNCADNDVLVVAAAGNDGCDCLHIPGALPSVLAVGAMNNEGQPMSFSNWGEIYRTQGILAPGENIPGAKPGGGTISKRGTSYATAIVSGISALLLSVQLKHRRRTSAEIIRKVLLHSAVGCSEQPTLDCRRLLVGRMNIKRAMAQIDNGENLMSDTTENPIVSESQMVDSSKLMDDSAGVQAAASESSEFESPQSTEATTPIGPGIDQTSKSSSNPESFHTENVSASSCDTCSSNGTPPQLVFALGQLGFDFGTEARHDSITQHMNEPANPNDPIQLLAYLKDNPWDAASIIWTLNLDATPIYAIQTPNAFANEFYNRLLEFLTEQNQGEVERISMPGRLVGSAQISSGQTLPLLWPNLRGMYNWNTKKLVEAAYGKPPSGNASQDMKDNYDSGAESVANFLQRVYEELRNLGTTPQERAINYAATNAFLVASVYKEAIEANMQLDTIRVVRSPVCRPESDCWDVKLTFFAQAKSLNRQGKFLCLQLM